MNLNDLDLLEKYKKTVKEKLESTLYLLDEELLSKQEDIKNEYISNIKKILTEIKSFMLENKKLGTIVFLLSRINLENEDFSYPVFIYGENMYIDNYEFSSSLDVLPIYKFYLEFKKEMIFAAKKYPRLISIVDAEKEVNKCIKYFNMYVVDLLRKIFMEVDVVQILKEINTVDEFFILQNEMYEKPYLIYKNWGV